MDFLINLKRIVFGFGEPPLLDEINLSIHHGERICLLGRNGVGKSTLIKIIKNELSPHSGSITKLPGLTIQALEQTVPKTHNESIFEIIASGLGEKGQLINQYHEITQNLKHETKPYWLKRLDEITQKMESKHAWHLNNDVEQIMTQLHIDAAIPFSNLSAGLKRRILLCKALVSKPNLLILDEPTNHLDIETIDMMETFLSSYTGTILFVTHDRSFLRKIANRIIELERGKLFDWSCDYDTFLKKKEAFLEDEAKQNLRFDQKLAKEEIWIRQGIKARRTRNEGRVKHLEKMRSERNERRDKMKNISLKIANADISGKRVIEAINISHAFAEKKLINNFSTMIMRGDRIGVIGSNGIGKTTFLNILLGKLTPTSGSIRLGTNLEIAYFDQLRNSLDEEKTLQQNISGEGDTIMINGQAKHIISYLKDFLFSPEKIRSLVKALSGGEKNRLLLAKLFTQSFNLLVLDEPTNDLDIETLELLEEMLLKYQGTLLLISHDRTFLNNVVTSTIAFEGNGIVAEYVGGYDDWLAKRPAAQQSNLAKKNNSSLTSTLPADKKKLSYKETKELQTLPQQIEQLEQEQAAIHQNMTDPNWYKQDLNILNQAKTRLETIEKQLASSYERWSQLESK